MTPSAPTKLSADETQITIAWTAPNPRGTPITGYEVWWNGGGLGTTYTKLTDVGATPLQYTLASGVTPGEFYSFKIIAKNGVGPSLLSAATQIRAATVPMTPAIPVLVYQDTTNIQFSWTPPYNGQDPIYDYKVIWDAGAGNSIFTTLASSTVGQTSYSTTASLSAGVYYQFKVIAVNNIGDSGPSQAISIIAATVPDEPFTPVKQFSDETSIEVGWTPGYNGGTPIQDYEVWWKLSTDADFVNKVLSTGNNLYYKVTTGLVVGLEYDFKVKAKNVVGLSIFSDSARFMAARVPDAPAAPTKLSANSS